MEKDWNERKINAIFIYQIAEIFTTCACGKNRAKERIVERCREKTAASTWIGNSLRVCRLGVSFLWSIFSLRKFVNSVHSNTANRNTISMVVHDLPVIA